jgi:hypothetical protein
MGETEPNESGNLFLQLVLTLQTSAMQHLGKFASPFTGKVERDLGSAKASVDMLVMLRDKTKGNLSDVEEKILGRVIYELQINYVDEANKPESAEAEEKPETEETEGGKGEGAGPDEKGPEAQESEEASGEPPAEEKGQKES